MKILSSGLVNGKWANKFGKRGSEFNKNGVPTCSIPFEILNAPEGTKSFAAVLEDKDAFAVCGFSWIHWTIANLKTNIVLENESQTSKNFLQGLNSWVSIQGGEQNKVLSSFYGGMAPPDAPHLYELHVFALDTTLDLKNGFLYNTLHKKMAGHILEEATLSGIYDN